MMAIKPVSAVSRRGPSQWLVPALGVVGTCIALIVFGALFQVYIEDKYCISGMSADAAPCGPWVTFFGALFKALFAGIAAFALVSMDVDLISYENKLRTAWITLVVVVALGLAGAILLGQWESFVAAVIGGAFALQRIKRRLNSHSHRRSLGVSHLS